MTKLHTDPKERKEILEKVVRRSESYLSKVGIVITVSVLVLVTMITKNYLM
jgi:hypothetical protein